jgi:hypothetical protein
MIPMATGGGPVGGATNLTTVGAVPYVSATGTLSQYAADLFWDATNNRLGIGTNAPTVTLDVAGSARIYDPTVTTGITQIIFRNGAGATSANRIFKMQDNAAANDLIWIDGSNTAPGIHGQLWYTVSQDSRPFKLYNGGIVAWSAGSSSDGGTYDAGMGRAAADMVEVNNSTSGALRDLKRRFDAFAVSTVASATTIALTTGLTHISGTTTIATITAPTNFAVASGGGCTILIPDGLWATNTAGNIAIATTAVVSKALEMCYDNATSKWYPSY